MTKVITWEDDGPFVTCPIPSVTITVRQATTLMFLLSDAAEFNAAMRDLSPNEVAKVFEDRRETCEEMSDVLNQRISEAHRATAN